MIEPVRRHEEVRILQNRIAELEKCSVCGGIGLLDDAQAWDCGQKPNTCPYCPERVDGTLQQLGKARGQIVALRQALKNIIDGAVDVRGMPAGSTYQELLITLTYVIEHARAALQEKQEKEDERT